MLFIFSAACGTGVVEEGRYPDAGPIADGAPAERDGSGQPGERAVVPGDGEGDPEGLPDHDGAPEDPSEEPVPADDAEGEPEERPDRSGFPDVAGHPAEEEILALSALGIVSGYPDGTFRPDQDGTRAELASMLALGLIDSTARPRPSFSDVPADHWAAGAIGAVELAGIMAGYPDGTFRPDAPATREEALVALASALHLEDAGTDELVHFADGSEVSAWARARVASAVRAGLLANEALLERADGRVYLRPIRPATRAALASFVFHALPLS